MTSKKTLFFFIAFLVSISTMLSFFDINFNAHAQNSTAATGTQPTSKDKAVSGAPLPTPATAATEPSIPIPGQNGGSSTTITNKGNNMTTVVTTNTDVFDRDNVTVSKTITSTTTFYFR
jgi:hypothetical protein